MHVHVCVSLSVKPNALRICKSDVKGRMNYGATSGMIKERNRIILSTSLEWSLSIYLLICVYFHQPWDIDTWLRCGQLWSGEKVNVCFMVHLLDIQIHL